MAKKDNNDKSLDVGKTKDKRNNKGQFEKGSGGRKKGTKNKLSQANKEEIEKLFKSNDGFNELFACINQVEDPKDKAELLLKVMPFFMAKHKELNVTGDDFSNYVLSLTVKGIDTPPIVDNENDIQD